MFVELRKLQYVHPIQGLYRELSLMRAKKVSCSQNLGAARGSYKAYDENREMSNENAEAKRLAKDKGTRRSVSGRKLVIYCRYLERQF